MPRDQGIGNALSGASLMRLLVLTSTNHIYANFIIKAIFALPPTFELVGIVESGNLVQGKKSLRGLWTYICAAGLYYVVSQVLKVWFFAAGRVVHGAFDIKNHKSPFFGFKRAARLKAVPLYKIDDINSPVARDIITSRKPDLLISIFFNQIINDQTLALARWGAINIHPSLLPFHRGVSPTFWALSMREVETGVTLHAITSHIDGGPILAQARFPIQPGDTEHSIYARACVAAVPLLVNSLAQWPTANAGKPNSILEKGSYHSLPTKQAVAAFRRSGKRFYTFSQLLAPFEKL